MLGRPINFATASDIWRFITCEDLGVISGTSGMLHRTIDLTPLTQQPATSSGQLMPVSFHSSGVVLIAKVPPRRIQIPCYNLSRFGKELLSLSDELKRDEDYERAFIDFLKAHGATVQRMVRATAAPGQGVPVEDV